MALRGLNDQEHDALDKRLLELLGKLEQLPQRPHADLAGETLALLDEHIGTLLYPSWHATWKRSRYIAWAWITTPAGEKDERLVAALEALARFALDANRVRDQGKFCDQAIDAVEDYLGLIEDEEERDGPIPPNGFRWQKRTARRLPALPYLLLEALWGGGQPFRPVPFDKLIRLVYREKQNNDPIRALLEIRRRAQALLCEDGVRIEIGNKNKHLQLQPFP